MCNMFMKDGSRHTTSTCWLSILLQDEISRRRGSSTWAQSSHPEQRLWRTVFDANRDVIGETLLLKGAPYTIVGVLPENANPPLNADL